MRGCYVMVGVLVVVLWGLSAGQAQTGQTRGPVLFTPQEAEALRLTEGEWAESGWTGRPRSIPLGPRIVFQTPQLQATSQGPVLEAFTPMDLIVLFEAQNTAVDMQSLRVQARKGIFTKSLTEMLRPYIQGARVEAKDVQVPAGRFLIQIEITDLQGVKTAETYRLEVKGR